MSEIDKKVFKKTKKEQNSFIENCVKSLEICSNQECFRFDDRNPQQFLPCKYTMECNGYKK